jgi:hypothetical protein
MRLKTTHRKEKMPLRPVLTASTTGRQRTPECGKRQSVSVCGEKGRRPACACRLDSAQKGEDASLTRIGNPNIGKATERGQ